MGIPNPPTLGRTVTISFEPREDKNGPGDYEMFVDIYGTEQDPVGIKIVAPEGWVVPANGVKLYQVQEEATSGSERVKPSKEKKQAIKKLKRGEYAEVFDGDLPQGFRFDSSDQTLYDSDSNTAIYEFLVHLIKPGENDFADPGVRNR